MSVANSSTLVRPQSDHRGISACARRESGTKAFQLYPVGGGEPQSVKGLNDGEVPIQWDDSGTKLYIWNRTFPAHTFLLDLKTGLRQAWTTLVPPDIAGVLYGNIVMTPDGKTSVYRYRRAMTTLYLAEGLK